MAIVIDLVYHITESINFRNAEINYFVKFSCEHGLRIVAEWFVGHIWSWKLSKHEVITRTPEELFLCKVLVTKVVNSKSNEIVCEHA